MRFRFEWNAWSTTPITAAIVVGSWGLMLVAGALLANLFGIGEIAGKAMTLSKGLFAGVVALVTFAAAAGLSVSPGWRQASNDLRTPKAGRLPIAR